MSDLHFIVVTKINCIFNIILKCFISFDLISVMETMGTNEHITFEDETDASQSVDENENSEDESNDDGISGDDDIDQVCAIYDDGGELLRYVNLSTSLSSIIRPLCFPIIHAFGITMHRCHVAKVIKLGTVQ
jgi:hypothetical protein